MNVMAVLSVTLILFSVIDMIGNIPIIINLKKDGLTINAQTTTLVSGVIMISFLFFGTAILSLFGIEITSFALAGSLVMFFIGLERKSNSIASWLPPNRTNSNSGQSRMPDRKSPEDGRLPNGSNTTEAYP